MNTSRRLFFKQAGIGAATFGALPLLSPSCSSLVHSRNIADRFSQGDVIVFQGDSITDAGRNRSIAYPNDASAFGHGYAHLLASFLLHELAGKELSCYNRGISGNKVFQLADRWEVDCLMLKPNVLSILIGVNDYWHFRQGNYEGTPEIYERDLRSLLQRTMDHYPDLLLMICQPFILTETKAVDQSWVEPFRAYQEIAKMLSEEFGALWVPFQSSFDGACQIAHPTYWAGDGVHPSMAGAQLMADTWLDALAM